MKQIWLIIEWQLPDGTGRVVKVVEGDYETAREAALQIQKPANSAVSISQIIHPQSPKNIVYKKNKLAKDKKV